MVPVFVSAVAVGVVMLANREAGRSTAEIGTAVPSAPRLQAVGGSEHLFRIDASRSSMTYSLTETLAGSDRTATGTTKGIAGDLVIDEVAPARSRVGDIVVNVEQLRSDQELRDRRLRADYLESSRFPLATFHTTTIEGLPDAVVGEAAADIRLAGHLTIKGVARAASVDAKVARAGGEIRITGSSAIKLSDYGIGPISIVGLVKTGDDVRLSFDVAAVDPAATTVPTEVAAPPRTEPTVRSAEAPSFDRQIKPLLESRCASCHEPNAVGSHTWTLTNARDAQSVAPGLGLVASSGYMPPWPASGKGVALEHDRRLTAEEIHTIVAWAESGAPLDVDPDTTIRATRDASGPTIRHDVTMRLPEPYQGSVERADDYRCFILDPKIERESFITGFEFSPDQTALVHHATIAKVTAAGRNDVDRLDAATPGSGWGCAIGAPLTVSTDAGAPLPSSGATTAQVSAWAPGQAATSYPEGTGLRVQPGDLFLIQIHYHVAHPPPPDRSSFAIQVTSGTALDDVSTATYFAPAEIPCAADHPGPLCDRDAVLRQLGESFGATAPLLPLGILTACGRSPADFATMTDGTAHASCTQPAGQAGEILWVMGHEHEIGASFRLTINAGRPDERVLLDIPRWSFDWQLVYRPRDKFDLRPGDTITTECSWDRSLRPEREPRYITWAEGTGDEMCMGIITTRAPR